MSNKIDRDKLRDLGVPDDVINCLDERDGGNIDPNGKVLFLDEQRQKRKEHPERPMRKNKSNGLGIMNAMAKSISKKVQASSPDELNKVFQGFLDDAAAPETSKQSKKFQAQMGFDEKGYTHGTVFPLNIDLEEKTQSMVLPVDLVIQAIEEAEYIAIVHECICRKSFGCKDHPTDLGCIFINMAGRRVVEAKIASPGTVEEAKAHIMKAAAEGLVANAEFVQGEQFIWGFRNDQMNEFRMICFCCSCCCLAFNVIKNSNDRVKERYTSCGYTSVIDHSKCIGCKKCGPVCPQKCISYREEDGRAVINQEKCMGCGFCKLQCKQGAISIRQTMPMRKSINEHFLKEARIDDGLKHRYD